MRLVALVFLLSASAAIAETNKPTVSRMNEAAGMPLFSESAVLWDEDADSVAKRLQLPLESRTPGDASYRLYPPDDVRLFGRRPRSIALSAQDGKPVALNIVFANKGDSFGQPVRTGPGQRPPRVSELLRDYRRAIDDDDKALEELLGQVLGPGEVARTGESSRLKERAARRDWNGHSLLLVSVRDEYVALRIVPPASLQDGGRVQRVPDDVVRARLAERVERRPNGDVVIRDIPMVDQGPKGFCVPATMERMLRHLGIPSDMYLLAMAANTDPGGGTVVDDVIAVVRQTAQRHGRRIVNVSGRPDATVIAPWIKAGIPVLWAINTSMSIDNLINERTRQRLEVTDWAAWDESLKPARRESRKLAREADEGHVCLITGFNAETGEIALSDSWGPGYEERWITEEEAKEISQGSMAVVAW